MPGVRGGGAGARALLLAGALAAVSLAALVGIPGAASAYVPRAPILIVGDAGFTPDNGVTGGSGTPTDPYVIEGWGIDASFATGISIANTLAHAVIRNVSVSGGDVTYDGVFLDTVANMVVEGGVFVGNAYGIVAYASSEVAIVNNRVANSFWEGILVESSSSAVVRGNDVQLAGVYGIDVFTSADVEVRDNTASTSAETGIYLQNVDRVVVSGNNASSNALLGIGLDYASDVTIIDNSLWDNGYGLDLFDSGRVLARQNTIGRSTMEAVSVYYSNNVTIDLNRFVSNEGGLFASFATDLTVAHNTFRNNVVQGGDELGTRTAWDRGYPAGGNFWSDYTGVDLCSGAGQDVCTGPDGIGDTPYAVDPDTVDRYPLMTTSAFMFPGSTARPDIPSMLSPPGAPRGALDGTGAHEAPLMSVGTALREDTGVGEDATSLHGP
ncbi:MAG TPA: NosD domain-containing protein [Thermoplasmata archaeon]